MIGLPGIVSSIPSFDKVGTALVQFLPVVAAGLATESMAMQ